MVGEEGLLRLESDAYKDETCLQSQICLCGIIGGGPFPVKGPGKTCGGP